jgi:hypothetical protein
MENSEIELEFPATYYINFTREQFNLDKNHCNMKLVQLGQRGQQV